MSSPTKRRRPVSVFYDKDNVFENYYLFSNSRHTLVKQTLPYYRAGSQYTVSEGHPFRSRKKDVLQDIGGPFFTQRESLHGIMRQSIRWSSLRTNPNTGETYSDVRSYKGFMAACDPSVAFPPSYQSSIDDLDEYGATAVARCKPTNPVAGLTAALAEIMQGGLPSLPGSQSTWENQAASARSAGGEYLNAQFGWAPLVNDISSFASGVIGARDVIERYKRGIGKITRKTYDFPIEEDVSESIISTNAKPWFRIPASDIVEHITPGTLFRRREVTQKRWFKGAFTYYFPFGISGKLGEYAILAQQLGLVPTPETVWQVAPWSWAVDWFSNTGDVISNWTSFHTEGLVMAYGYMMEHTIVKDTYTLEGCKSDKFSLPPLQPLTLVTETKVRTEANPYGFGVKWDGLSAFQSSILGALGLNKGIR